MLMSWAIAQNSHSQSLMFLQKPNLFNVAITRARKRLINFISKPINELPEGLLRDYLEFVQSQDRVIASRKNTFKNLFEKEVFEALSEEFTTHTLCAGVDFAGINADIMIDGKLIVEVDGVEEHLPFVWGGASQKLEGSHRAWRGDRSVEGAARTSNGSAPLDGPSALHA